MRVFVYIVLKNELLDKWDTSIIREGDSINHIAKQRMRQAKDYGYLSYEIQSPMLYLSSGDLIDLILSDANWKYFAKYFKSKKEILKHKLLEIGAIRNALAHFRPIHEEDIDVIKQNVKHTLMGVEEFLSNIFSVTNKIPSNTSEEWYQKLIALESENINIKLTQDTKNEWINIQVVFNAPIFNKEWETNNSKSLNIGNLLTISILDNYKNLTKNIIYTEENVSNYIPMINDIQIIKEISFVISKRNLQNNINNLMIELNDLFDSVEREIQLIKEDNLAQGKFINTTNIYISSHEPYNYWSANSEKLLGNLYEINHPEFFGNVNMNSYDFISSSQQYPWMPVTISPESDEIPF